MLNVSTRMNETQVEYTARMILAENPLLTIADIKYVFDSAVTGKYGLLYNRLDPQVICTWFRKHWDDRLEAAENESMKEHSQHNSGNYERTAGKEIQAFKDAFKRWAQEQKPDDLK